MSTPPTGTVTFLFTDIEGSTKLSQQYPDAILVFAVEGLASLNVNRGRSERAVRLFAWTAAMREKMGDHRPPVEQASVERDLAIVHSKLDDTEFTRLTAEGHALTMEQAIAPALEE